MSSTAQVLLLVAVLAVFWLIAVRPARRRQREVDSFQSRLEVGQRVVLSAGIFGTITTLHRTRVELEIAPGTVITVARQVVLREASVEADDEPTDGPTDGPTDRPLDGPPDEAAPRERPQD